MSDIEKNEIQEEKLENVSGGAARKRAKAQNGSCPQCGKPISVCSWQNVEGQINAVGTFWCHDCDIRWLRDEFKRSYTMVTLTPNANGRLEILGPFKK